MVKPQGSFAAGITGMIFSNLFFSLMAILIRMDPGISGFQAAFFRFSVGACVVATLALFGFSQLRFRNFKGLLVRGLVGGVSVLLYYLPINEIGLGKSSLFQYTYPFYAILFSALFFHEKVSRSVWALLGLTMAGQILLSLSSLLEGNWNIWVVSAWASGLTSGLAVMFVKRLTETETSLGIFLAQCLGGFWIIILPAHAFPVPVGWGPAVLLLAIGLTAAAGQILMTWSYKHVDVSTGSLLGTLVPILNLAAGVAFFRESFTPAEAAGAGITLLACILLVFVKRDERRKIAKTA